MSLPIDNLNESVLEELTGKVIGDVAGSLGLLMAYTLYFVSRPIGFSHHF